MFYHTFILDMRSSPGFGSILIDLRTIHTRFPFGSAFIGFTSPIHYSKGTRSLSLPLPVGIRFQVLFHSPPGVLFTFPSRYFFTIGRLVVFSLGVWSPLIQARFLVSDSTWDKHIRYVHFSYRAFTFFSVSSQILRLYTLPDRISHGSPNAFPLPSCTIARVLYLCISFGSSAFARHY